LWLTAAIAEEMYAVHPGVQINHIAITKSFGEEPRIPYRSSIYQHMELAKMEANLPYRMALFKQAENKRIGPTDNFLLQLASKSNRQSEKKMDRH
jgi:hypothetical protein